MRDLAFKPNPVATAPSADYFSIARVNSSPSITWDWCIIENIEMRHPAASVIVLLVLCCGVFSQHRSGIHSIDFRNFTYPGSRGHFSAPEYESSGFTLKNGKSGNWKSGRSLERVLFGDVTGDRREEAIVVMNAENDGSAVVKHVYIYTLKNGRPKFLWGFEGGDRSQGGLRKVYATNGGLAIELWGKETHLGGDLNGSEPTAMCCPKFFTRSFYVWRNGTFKESDKSEILPNPMAATQCPACLPDAEDKEWH